MLISLFHSSANAQKGNVLFFILIAVALFTALSFAVSSTRGGGPDSSKETLSTNVSTILNHVSALQSAVTRLKLSSACSDSELNFTNSVYKTGHGALTMPINANAPSNGKCDVYSPSGGGLFPFVFPKVTQGAKAGNNAEPLPGVGSLLVTQIKNVGSDAASSTSSANDLTITFYNPSLKTCLALNEALGITNPSGIPPTISRIPGQQGGSYADGSFDTDGISSGTYINGQTTFCAGSSGIYNFYVVLLAR